MEKAWYTGEDAEIIEKTLEKYRGMKDNPLTGMTFREILEKSKRGEL